MRPTRSQRLTPWKGPLALTLVCSAAWFWGSALAQNSPAVNGPSIGPFRLGMSLEDIRAATPQTRWRDTRLAAFSGRVTAISTLDTVAIEGLEFQVQAQAPYYQHGLRLQAASPAASATACEQAALTWLSRVENQLGPFQSLAPRQVAAGPNSLQWNVQRGAGGSVSVTPSMNLGTPGRTEGQSLKLGVQSSVLVEAFDDTHRSRPRKGLLGGEPERLKLSAFNRGNNHRVDITVEFHESPARNCSTQVDMERWTLPPAPKVFDTETAKLLSQPSIAERHWAMPAAAPPLTAAVDVQLRCDIERLQGQTRRCGVVAPSDLNRQHAAAAMRLAQGLTYDMSGVDRDDPQAMQAIVRVRLQPDDRKLIDFLSLPATPAEDLQWEEQADEEDFKRAYPLGLQGTPPRVSVKVTCQIQRDGSLDCAGAELDDIPHRHEFVFAATRVATLGYRASIQLRNGQPSAGRVVHLVIELRRS